jgi:hypothetical protein
MENNKFTHASPFTRSRFCIYNPHFFLFIPHLLFSLQSSLSISTSTCPLSLQDLLPNPPPSPHARIHLSLIYDDTPITISLVAIYSFRLMILCSEYIVISSFENLLFGYIFYAPPLEDEHYMIRLFYPPNFTSPLHLHHKPSLNFYGYSITRTMVFMMSPYQLGGISRFMLLVGR